MVDARTIRRSFTGPGRLAALLAALAALIAVPAAAPEFYVYILALILVTGLLATSLNLALGYGGIYQFHHAVFYGTGAYTLALAVVKVGWPAWVGFAAGPVVAAAAGALVGAICVRLTRLYFGMLQLSLGSLIWTIALRWYPVTGGDDGIHGIPLPAFLQTVGGAYYFIVGAVALSLMILHLLVRSPFGATLQAVRDNPQRCQAIGVDVRAHQLVAIVIASFFGGVAGVLYVALERSVFPNMLFWVLSLEILVMCLLGGWFTFLGPMVGAALIVALRTVASRYTDNWTMILGTILILLIFFMPDGVMGHLQQRFGRRRPVEGSHA
ncbi:MAG: branched-chain amino acid ABC transporter permease [Armatimonadota bacterium]